MDIYIVHCGASCPDELLKICHGAKSGSQLFSFNLRQIFTVSTVNASPF